MKINGIEVSEVLEFGATPGFGKWKKYFPKKSVSHPAKMNLNLLEYLILKYTNEDDVILDPMMGTGSTIVLSMLNNRNAIGVELEEKFTAWAKEAIKNVEKSPLLTLKGKGIAIKGDARNLSELLKEHEEEVSCALFSPPYASSFRHNPQDKEKRLKRLKEVEEQAVKEGRKWALSSDEALERQVNRQDWGYGDDERNIGNLPMGEVGSILFSPPYSLGHDSGDNASEKHRWRLEEQKKHTRAYNEGNNIAKLPHGEVDSVIFSPPFGQVQKGGGIAQKGYEGQYGRDERLHLRHDRPLSDKEDNISNLPYGVDVVLTSPPYSETLNEKKNTTSNLLREERLRTAGHQPKDFMGGIARNCQLEDGMRYSHDERNIGNLPHGAIDACLFSPPFFNSLYHLRNKPPEFWEKLAENTGRKAWLNPEGVTRRTQAEKDKGYSDEADNIGNLKDFGADVVLTSPPYEGSLEGTSRHTRGGIASRDKKLAQTGSLTMISEDTKKHEELISRIITSPPYEESMGDKHHSPRGDKIAREKRHYNTYTEAKKKNNIGNLRKETYLSAMLTVYEQCYLVLKQGGRMIIVIKNFIRNKKLVPLSEQTIKLCERVGFKLEERLLFKLPQMSFWRILEKRRWEKEGREYPNDMSYEHILVFRK